MKLAKEEGIELNDEQLEAVSGGCDTENDIYPRCHRPARIKKDVFGEHTSCICGHCGTYRLD